MRSAGVERASRAAQSLLWRLRRGDVRERGDEGRRERSLEVSIGQSRKAVLEGDGLALLGELEPPGRMSGRLREDRGVGRPAATTRAAAATVEDRQLDATPSGQAREQLLRPEDLPLRGEIAAVLSRVRVADHHLEPRAASRDEATETCVVEQLLHDLRRRAQRLDRLEERDERELEALRLRQVERAEDVVGRRRARHDQRVDGLRTMGRLGTCNGGDRLPHAFRRRTEILGVKTNVELRQVEAEELDAPPQRGEPSVGDALCTAGTKAPVEDVEIERERRRRRVALPVAGERVAQAPPGEAELASVGLVEIAILELERILGKLLLVTCDRGEELGRGRGELGRDPDDLGELAHLRRVRREGERPGLAERLGDRLRAGRRIAVEVAPDPGAEAERCRRIR